MKLNKEVVDFIINVVTTANIVNVDRIIIEPSRVRAMNEGRTVGLFTDSNVPDVPYEYLGLARISELLNRANIAKDMPDFSIDFAGNDDHVTQMIIKAKGLKIDYRCGDPRKIAAPKVINDVECFKVKLTEDAVKLYQNGINAMGSEEVSIVSNNGVSFEFADLSHDIYKYTFADTVEKITNAEGEVASSDKFAHRYPAKTLLALFKHNPEAEFTVALKGILRFPLNGLTVFVLPIV